MYTNFPLYPTGIFTNTDYPTQVDNTNVVYADLINALRAEIQACFNELGVLPKRSYTDVNARLNAISIAAGMEIADPISQLKMNDKAATKVVIDSMGNNNGTAQQNTVDISVAGKINDALEFNGVDDYIDLGYNSNLKPTAEITISVWAKPATLNPYAWVISKPRGSGIWNDYGIRAYSTSSSFILTTLNNNISLTGSDGQSVGVWRHIAATYDGSYVRLYINGVEVDSDPATGAIQYDDTESYKYIYLGEWRGPSVGNEVFGGAIDDVRIYNFALSDKEVGALWNNGDGTEEQNPLP